ncbi:MAG: DUF3641 domain-containing protein [Cyanobacteria bacterium QS_8_64_29]|nr:MAG: DUF3641 domain-containing protein [Cyanobacteria bacterium QS_8_64_29]
MVQTPVRAGITPFRDKIGGSLSKHPIRVLQINLGKRCNLACTHCHVEAGPNRTEELSPEVRDRLIALIERFPQIETVDLTGGTPEMNLGFRPLVEAARAQNKQAIVRSNLSIYFQPGFEDVPEFCARHQARVAASLPCYLPNNVDSQRGAGVYDASIRALQRLNQLGYGHDPELVLDLIYNPPLPLSEDGFRLPPPQQGLEQDYKTHLQSQFGIQFNNLLTLANLPIGRTKQFLQRQQLHAAYLRYLEANFNPQTVPNVMCRNQLSVDYTGNVFDCDFNQMENLPAQTPDGEPVTVEKLLALDSLDAIEQIQTRPYCYGCTAGNGSSCGGSLV